MPSTCLVGRQTLATRNCSAFMNMACCAPAFDRGQDGRVASLFAAAGTTAGVCDLVHPAMQKALMRMNLQQHHVASDIKGMTGMSIIRTIAAGERGCHASVKT